MNFRPEITEREKVVLYKICEQKTAKEIGADLGLHQRTIEGVKLDISTKLGTKSVVGMALYAVKHNIFQI